MGIPKHQIEPTDETVSRIDGFIRRRNEVLASSDPGHVGAAALSTITDETISELASIAEASLRAPWAVVALGGYGASRMLPGSDVDLLIVSDDVQPRLKEFVSEILYPLWDLGLTVGHQVRSAREHIRAIRTDLDTMTATLTGRFVAGDAHLAADLLERSAHEARKRGARLLEQLWMRDRPGSPYLLEPDLKQGAGGQRDLDELTWTAAILTGHPQKTPAALLDLGLLTQAELQLLRAAESTLSDARWHLHGSAGRGSNLMTIEVADDPALDAQRTQASLADTHHILLGVRESIRRHAASLMGSGTRGARDGSRSQTAHSLTIDNVFSLVADGPGGLPELEHLAWSGVLDPLIPGFSALRALRRPALSHRYTVGAHSLRALTLLAEIGAHDEAAASVMTELTDPRPLLLATLLHDIGKAADVREHAAVGAQAAKDIALTLGLAPEQIHTVEVLVREHLLLANVAFGSDIHDEDVVLRTASHLENREQVGLLYALTVADTLATSPDMWTPWRRKLIATLSQHVEAALSEDVVGAGIAATAERIRATVLAAIEAGPSRGSVARFAETAPIRYLAQRDADQVLADAALLDAIGPKGSSEPYAIRIGNGPLPRTWRVTIATEDRHGRFASLAGVLSLVGLDILEAEAYSGGHGRVLDFFTVTPATLAHSDDETWAALRRYLSAELSGHLALEVRLAERRRHYRPVRDDIAADVRSEVIGGYSSTVTVKAADRVGLLHDLALAVSRTGLDIRYATAHTRDGIASDTFGLIDEFGDAPDDPGILGHLAMRLREVAGS